MCTPCSGIEQRVRRALGHAALEHTATRHLKRMGQPLMLVTLHVCADCGTHWQFEDGELGSGWSVQA